MLYIGMCLSQWEAISDIFSLCCLHLRASTSHLFFSFDLYPLRCFSLSPTFSIFFLAPLLPLASVSTLSSSCGYWFLLLMRSSTWIQTRPFAWLPINIRNSGIATLLFATNPQFYSECVLCKYQRGDGHSDDHCISERFWHKRIARSTWCNFTGRVAGTIVYKGQRKSPLTLMVQLDSGHSICELSCEMFALSWVNSEILVLTQS